MAAVTVSSSIKSLFLMFTLLCLLCLSSSLIGKDQLGLRELRENYQKMKQQMDTIKVQYEKSVGFTSEVMSQFMGDPVMAQLKKREDESADGDFPPVGSLMESIGNYMEVSKAYSDRKHKELGGDIKEIEKKLEILKSIIEFLEEKQAEL